VTVEVFRHLVERLLEFDPETIGEIARLLTTAKSPLAPLVRELAREKTRAGFDAPVGALGAALRQQSRRARADAKSARWTPSSCAARAPRAPGAERQHRADRHRQPAAPSSPRTVPSRAPSPATSTAPASCG
jgi:hypothetical protein